MSKTRLAGVLVVALAAGAAVTAAQNIVVETHVPFAFVVENTTLPMGDYVVERAHSDQVSPMVLRSSDGKTSVAFLCLEMTTRNEKPAAESELVFEEVDGQNFLREIWIGGERTGFELVKSRSFADALRHANGSGARKSVKGHHAT